MELDEINKTAKDILQLEDAIAAHMEGRNSDVDSVEKAVKCDGLPKDESTRKLVKWVIKLGHRKGDNLLLTEVPLTESEFGPDGEVIGDIYKTVPLDEAKEKLLELRRNLGGLLTQQYPKEGEGLITVRIDKLLNDIARNPHEEHGATRRTGEVGMN